MRSKSLSDGHDIGRGGSTSVVSVCAATEKDEPQMRLAVGPKYRTIVMVGNPNSPSVTPAPHDYWIVGGASWASDNQSDGSQMPAQIPVAKPAAAARVPPGTVTLSTTASVGEPLEIGLSRNKGGASVECVTSTGNVPAAPDIAPLKHFQSKCNRSVDGSSADNRPVVSTDHELGSNHGQSVRTSAAVRAEARITDGNSKTARSASVSATTFVPMMLPNTRCRSQILGYSAKPVRH